MRSDIVSDSDEYEEESRDEFHGTSEEPNEKRKRIKAVDHLQSTADRVFRIYREDIEMAKEFCFAQGKLEIFHKYHKSVALEDYAASYAEAHPQDYEWAFKKLEKRIAMYYTVVEEKIIEKRRQKTRKTRYIFITLCIVSVLVTAFLYKSDNEKNRLEMQKLKKEAMQHSQSIEEDYFRNMVSNSNKYYIQPSKLMLKHEYMKEICKKLFYGKTKGMFPEMQGTLLQNLDYKFELIKNYNHDNQPSIITRAWQAINPFSSSTNTDFEETGLQVWDS